jgi:hypothetical protein
LVRSLGAATLELVADWEVLRRVTVIEALPEIAPTVAVIVALPAVLAVKVTRLPGFGVKVPSDTDQVGVTETELPYRSCPVAAKRSCPPRRAWALVGETAIVASAAAFTVSVWFASP